MSTTPADVRSSPSRSSAPRQAPPSHFTDRAWRWSSGAFAALGHRFVVRSELDELRHWTEQTFAALAPAPSADEPDPVAYSVLDRGPREHGRFVLYRGGERLALADVAKQLVRTLLWDINHEAVASVAHEQVALHAAAVHRDGIALLLPAAMESGKTTTAAGLLRSGRYGYLTDEAAVLTLPDLTVRPFRKALAVDRGSWGVLADMEPEAVPVVDQWQVPPARWDSFPVAEGLRPGLIVSPAYRPGATTRTVQLAPAAAVLMLAQCTFDFRSNAARLLPALARLAESTPAYQLEIGDLDEAVALIDELFDGRAGSGAVS